MLSLLNANRLNYDTFAEAKNLLKFYSIILSQSRYESDPDGWNEDLNALRLVHVNEKRPAQPLPKREGVMSAEPQDLCSQKI